MKTAEMHVQFESPLKWKQLGEVVEIEGVLLAPGVFTGIDGETIRYQAGVIHEAHEHVEPMLMELRHNGKAAGFISQHALDGDTEVVKGYVFLPSAIEEILAGRAELSADQKVWSEWNPELNCWDASQVRFSKVAIVPEAACDACVVREAKVVQLQEGKENLNGQDLQIDAYDNELILATQDAKPSKSDFFSWLESQLKKAGLDAAAISKAMQVLRSAIKVPYPYPYPKAGYPAKGAADLEGVETVSKEDHDKQLKAKDEEYQELLKQFEALQEEGNKKELETIESEIKEFEPEFTSTAMLEKIKDHPAKVVLLEKYRDILKSKKVKLAVDDTKDKDRVSQEMFGASFNDMFPSTEGGK